METVITETAHCYFCKTDTVKVTWGKWINSNTTAFCKYREIRQVCRICKQGRKWEERLEKGKISDYMHNFELISTKINEFNYRPIPTFDRSLNDGFINDLREGIIMKEINEEFQEEHKNDIHSQEE